MVSGILTNFYFGILGALLSGKLVSLGLIAALVQHWTLRPESAVLETGRGEMPIFQARLTKF
jgi:hypothetical protein